MGQLSLASEIELLCRREGGRDIGRVRERGGKGGGITNLVTGLLDRLDTKRLIRTSDAEELRKIDDVSREKEKEEQQRGERYVPRRSSQRR